MTPMRRNQNWLPFVFNDLFDNDWMMKANSTAPAINVIESDKEYHVEVAAPGMTKNDFNIRIDEDDNLVVSMMRDYAPFCPVCSNAIVKMINFLSDK